VGKRQLYNRNGKKEEGRVLQRFGRAPEVQTWAKKDDTSSADSKKKKVPGGGRILL